MVHCQKDYVVLWICIIGSTGVYTVGSVYSAVKETEIRSETVLASTYDNISRPSTTTTVQIGISLLAIEELDVKGQRLKSVGWVTFKWVDSRLTWSPAAKDNIKEIFSKPEDMWKPELVIANSLEDAGLITNDDLNLRIKYDGTVEWEPPRVFTTHCQVDITYYPYDKQKCSIDVAGWSYTVNEVALITLTTPLNMKDFMAVDDHFYIYKESERGSARNRLQNEAAREIVFRQNGEWKILSTSTVISNIVEDLDNGTIRQFPRVKFLLYLERRRDYYSLNVILPTFLTSLLVALTFLVPVRCGEKLSYILTVFLSTVVLQTLVADSLPSTSITTSVLGLYLGVVTVFAAFGMFLTIIILVLYFKEGNVKQDFCIIDVIRCCAGIVCLSDALRVTGVETDGRNEYSKPSVSGAHAQNDENDLFKIGGKESTTTGPKARRTASTDQSEISWKNVALILDRLCFLLFSVVTFLMNLSFVISLSAGGSESDP